MATQDVHEGPLKLSCCHCGYLLLINQTCLPSPPQPLLRLEGDTLCSSLEVLTSNFRRSCSQNLPCPKSTVPCCLEMNLSGGQIAWRRILLMVFRSPRDRWHT